MNFKPLARVDFLAVHCSADPAATAWDVDAATIRQRHRQKGWRDIGFHFVIRMGGMVEAGRPVTQPGAHEPRINSRSLGICLVGYAPFTPAQLGSLETLLRDLKTQHPEAEVIGLRDVPGVRSTSPGFDVREWWAALNP